MSSKKKLLGKRVSKARVNKGKIDRGTIFWGIFIVLAGSFAYTLIGAQLPKLDNSKTGSPVVIITPPPEEARKNLQLYTFQGVTVTPTPTPAPTTPPSATGTPISPGTQAVGCEKSKYNEEPENFLGVDPAPPGGAVSNGRIRAWKVDEMPGLIAPDEIVDPNTGEITKEGDRQAKDDYLGKEPKFLWEPTVYVAPASGNPPTEPFCDATKPECKPYFPIIIKGDYNSDRVWNLGWGGGTKRKGPPISSDWKNFQNGNREAIQYAKFYTGEGEPGSPSINEYIWDVTKFGLPSGSYWAQFVIHGGDPDNFIFCITIKI